MTRNSNFKRRVRARAAKTGESYTTALRHLRSASPDGAVAKSAPRVLTIEKRSLLKSDLQITDDGGELLYSTSWSAGFPTGVWTLKRGDAAVATLRRKALAPLRTSVVVLDGQEFTLRKRLAVSRASQIHGGPFDGAILSGSFSDMDFRLQHRGALIAGAKAKLLSMKDRHSVCLQATDDPAAELLTAVMMVDLLVQKHEEF
jgi:uncharacterized protein YxjI